MADTLDSLIADFSSYIVAPLNAFGLGGFLFDVATESMANLSAEITDHYTEDNKAVQDHIAIRPKRITLRGYVGELIFANGDQSSPSLTETLTQKLTTISGFLPTLSAAATQIQQTIQNPSASSVNLSDAANIYGAVQNLLPSTGNGAKQQNAYAYFQSLLNQKVLMGIQTPWEFITNMAIESIVAIQDENSIYVSDFSITLKQMRFAQTLTTAFGVAQSIFGDAGLQAQNPVNIGNQPGVTLPSSILPQNQQAITSGSSLVKSPISVIFKGEPGFVGN
jgi:hypothetical protein